MRLCIAIASAAALNAAFAAHAADGAVCPGNPELAKFQGIWVRPALLADLKRTRSWAATMTWNSETTLTATLYVSAKDANFNLNWHEGDNGNVCVRHEQGQLWARRLDETSWVGPYVHTDAENRQQEGVAYLEAYFSGCFRSDRGERWCLSPRHITVNGKPFFAELQMDLSEGPLYGTAFATRATPLPFTVFVPHGRGWDVFQDDWASNPDRHPIDPAKDRPWRRLTAE